MLNEAKEITGCNMGCVDGEIGKIENLFFDDRHWAVRYLVADTGGWLPGRQVLISPYALGGMSGQSRDFDVSLTRRQINESPPLDMDEPVTRQFEEIYYAHYGWPKYWDGPHMWGTHAQVHHDRGKWSKPSHPEKGKGYDYVLRSANSVRGYFIHAADSDMGRVEDFIIDEDTWAIRYLLINTRNWWLGKHVLVSPHWIDRVSWEESKVFVGIPRDAIKQSPEYTGKSMLDRDYEMRLHDHYKLPGYWEDEMSA